MRRIIGKLAAVALTGALAMVLLLAPATVAMAANKFWKNSVVSPGSWINGNNWSATSAIGVDNAGAPAANDAAHIRPTDGQNHTITYDYMGAAITLGGLYVDLTGAGATTTTLSMSGNNLTSTFEYVGYNGQGTFNHSGGTNTIAAGAGFLDVGVFAGSSGTYNLSGTGALVANTNVYIGDVGTGVFNQTGGSNVMNGFGHDLYLGYNAVGTSGAYALSAGELTVNNGIEYIGYRVTGTFTQTGGTNTPRNGVSLGTNAGSTGTYTLSAGSLLSAAEIIGDAGTGTFTQTGGTNGVGYGADVVVGNAVGSTGTYNLSGTSTFGSGHDLVVGLGGTGTINQSGGVASVAQRFDLGENAGSTGTYNLSGGSLDANTSTGYATFIGGNGNATFNQTGGTSILRSVVGVELGSGGGSTGTFLLSGGTSTISGSLYVGNGGTGTLTVSGSGVLTIGSFLWITNAPGNAINLNGGVINAPALNFNGDPTRFHWTAGTLNVTSGTTWDSSASGALTSAAFGAGLALGPNQTLKLTGNETLGGAGAFSLTLNAGGSHQVTGTMTISTTGTITQNAGSVLYAGAIVQSGGTVNGTLQNQTTFTYQSGLFNGRLVNQGIVSFGSSFVVGNGVENNVTMTVAAGQTLTTNGAGLDNRALFTIASGGNLVGTSIANQSEFIVNGSATATTFSNTALLHGVGQVTAAVTNAASGDVRVVAGESLRFAGASFTNQGLVEAIGNATSPAEIEFNSPVTNASSTGLITGRNNVLRFNGGLTNQGSLAVSIGASDVFGDISNSATGKIVVSGGAGVTFYDDIVQNGTFRVSKVGSTTSVAVVFGAFSGSGGSTGGGDIFFEGDLRPGNSPATVTFDNNVAFGSGVSLEIELGGTTPGTMYDQVHVSGQLALDGELNVSLINNFAPAAGQAFDILDWGTLSGTFDSIQLPTLAGALGWNTSQLYTTGVLSVVSPGVSGDYNNNGVVDAADYVVWRKGLGTTYAQNDYNVWRANFGQTAGSGAGASANAAVPEPATLVLLMFAAAGWCLRPSRN